MNADALDTPAVLIDLDVLERNIARMAAYCREHGLRLRPHTKTHKNAGIARKQVEAGAVGITVAKPGEAEVMAAGGIDDILIAYPIVSAAKARRVAELASRCRIAVSLDSTEAIDVLSAAALETGYEIGVLIEVDAGFSRCGVGTGEQSVALARHALDRRGLRFEGLMFYPGHIKVPLAEQKQMIAEVNRRLREHYAAFAAGGIALPTVSGGSTPTALRSHEFEGVTEIRPGMYAFLDRNMLEIGAGSGADCAVSVLTTVVSTAVPGRAMIDGGSKTFSSDPFITGAKTFGAIVEHPDAALIGFSEEHGHVDTSRAAHPLRVGERLHVIPNHVCATINLHDRVYGIRGGVVESCLAVDARGRLQ